MPHRVEIVVRGYHLDLYGHVNNARYLEFLEEGRWALLEDRGGLAAFTGRGLAFYVVRIAINYRLPASIGDILEIETGLASVGRRSAVLSQVVRRAGDRATVADAEVTFCVADSRTGKALPLDGETRDLLDTLR